MQSLCCVLIGNAGTGGWEGGSGGGGVYMCERGGVQGNGWGLGGSGPHKKVSYLYAVPVWTSVCLGKDDRIALHWNCATGRGGRCVWPEGHPLVNTCVVYNNQLE